MPDSGPQCKPTGRPPEAKSSQGCGKWISDKPARPQLPRSPQQNSVWHVLDQSKEPQSA